MGLISGKYWTGDPKIKPEAWGPKSTVSSNAVDYFNSNNIDFPIAYWPMWESAGNTLTNLSSPTDMTIVGGKWDNNSLLLESSLLEYTYSNAIKQSFSEITISCSFTVPTTFSVTAFKTLVAKWDALNNNRQFFLGFAEYQEGLAVKLWLSEDGTYVKSNNYNAFIDDLCIGETYNIVATWKASPASPPNIYVNGEKKHYYHTR